jgi:hypothetical protein
MGRGMQRDPDIRPHLESRFIGGGCVSAMEGEMTQGEIASRFDGIVAAVRSALDDGKCSLATLQTAQKRLANLVYEIDQTAIIAEIGDA